MQQISWDQFGLKAESKQSSFEDLSMFLCCRELGITKIEAYQNQPGIETEPFEANGKKYGFQAKFFDNKFDWQQIKKSIEKAINDYPELDKIFIYSNKHKTTNLKEDTKTKAETELEKKAKKAEIELEWITEKDIKLKLSIPSNFDLAQLFFGLGDEFSFIKNSTNPKILTFLQSSEFFKLPFVDKNDGTKINDLNEIFSSTNQIFLISGHPGSGKTIYMHRLLQLCGGLDKEDKEEMLKVLTQNKAVPILVNLKNCATDSLESILRDRKNDCNVGSQELGFIYILDGLDELSEENAENVLLQIYERSNRDSTKKIIISCRTGNINKIKARQYFSDLSEYQIADLGKEFIDKYFEVKKGKTQKLAEIKEKNRTLVNDIKDIFLIKLLWDTIDELDESSTSIDLFSKKIDSLLNNPKHRKNIEGLNLPNPKREQIIELNKDISFEFQKEFQFRFSQAKLQKLILERFERLDYKSTNEILNYIADLFFEDSYSENQEKLKTYIYQHRRYQEFFFAQKLKDEYEKNPKVLRELNVLSNREFFEKLFLKYLRKEYKNENNLAGLLELNLIDVYLGNFRGFGADEPYYLASDDFIPALACQNETVFNELIESETLQIREKLNIDFKSITLLHRSKKTEAFADRINSFWIWISKDARDQEDAEYKNRLVYEEFENLVYFKIIYQNSDIQEILENLVRKNYEVVNNTPFGYGEHGKEKLIKSFIRVCLTEDVESFLHLSESFDDFEFTAFLDVILSIEFLPFFIQTKKLHKKIKSFVNRFSDRITDKNFSILFYKTFFDLSLSESEKGFIENKLKEFHEMRDIDWRTRKGSHHNFSITTFGFDSYSFDKLFEEEKDYTYAYFREQELYSALFKDFISLLNGDKELRAIVRDYLRYIRTYTEWAERIFPSREISTLWANIFAVSGANQSVKLSVKNTLIDEKQTFNPYSFYVELNRIDKYLFNEIVNESELELFENHLSEWSDDFPSFIERCFVLARWFSDFNPEKARFYVVKGINDGLMRHNWRKDIIVCYLLVNALEIFWKNNWLSQENLKEVTNKIFNLTWRAAEITDGKYTSEGPNKVIEVVLKYDIEFAEELKNKLVEKRPVDYFQNSLITNLLVAKAKRAYPIEEIEKSMFEFRYDRYRHQNKNHFGYYLEKFPVYLEIAENDLYTKKEQKEAFDWLYEKTDEVIEKEYNLELDEDEKQIFEKLCEKHQKEFRLTYKEKDENRYERKPYENFIADIKNAKSKKAILEIYGRLKEQFLSEPENWKLLIEKTFEICGNIQAFISYLEESYYPSTDFFTTNSEYLHFGLAVALQNIDTRQEILNYLHRNSGHGGFINVMKAYEEIKDKKMCLLLFERYLRFCDFLVN